MVGVEVGNQDKVRLRSLGGGSGPRTRRRWPSRAVRTGSNRTVVAPSRHVLVLCPHHVSVPVIALLARFSSRSGSGIGLDHIIGIAAPLWWHQAHRRRGARSGRCNLQVRVSAGT